ncbi:MAG TPA: DUF504 domain-containing protein [Thioalkalivibrio sp.]|nr:DUF504 domain-containing protein [Thioalkalivibrio sp.]
MQPIHELLNRIRWDEEFARGEFVIGYLDHVNDRVVHVNLRDVAHDPEDHFRFEVYDEDGERHAIPYHRVREVYKNGELIWRRE